MLVGLRATSKPYAIVPTSRCLVGLMGIVEDHCFSELANGLNVVMPMSALIARSSVLV